MLISNPTEIALFQLRLSALMIVLQRTVLPTTRLKEISIPIPTFMSTIFSCITQEMQEPERPLPRLEQAKP